MTDVLDLNANDSIGTSYFIEGMNVLFRLTTYISV